MPKLLLAGYFGCGNIGDDAILHGFLNAVQGVKAEEIVVLSGSPEETFRLYRVRSVPRKDMAAVKNAIEDCDVLVFPGGSIFQDVTSLGSPYYYSKLVSMAKKAKKRVVFLAQGVGPLNKFIGRSLAARAFQAADAIAVRDPASVAVLNQIGIKRQIEVTADMAFLMPPLTEERTAFQVGDMKTVGLAPRPWGKGDQVVQIFAELARALYNAGYMPVMIPMDQKVDMELIRKISDRDGGKIPDIRSINSPKALQERMVRMEGIFAMRLHAGILATTVGVPAFMLSYDPKVSAFAKLMQMHDAPMVDAADAKRLAEQFVTFLKNSETNRRILETQRADLVDLARKNMTVLERVIGRTGPVVSGRA